MNEVENDLLEKENQELEQENQALEFENSELEQENKELEEESLQKSRKIRKLTSIISILTILSFLLFIYSSYLKAIPADTKTYPNDANQITKYKTKYDNHQFIDEIGFTTEDPNGYENYMQQIAININNVDDVSQEDYYKYNLQPGCGPIAIMDILKYWSKNGFENLNISDDVGMYNIVRDALKCYKTDKGEATNMVNIESGLKNYTKSKGYSSKINDYYKSDNMWDEINSEIQNNRPVIAGIRVFEGTEINHCVIITGTREYTKTKSDGTKEKSRYIVINDGYRISKGSSFAKYNPDCLCIITYEPQK